MIRKKQKWILLIALLSYFLTALSFSIVITGLLKIKLDLQLNQIELSWVQNAYGLAFGSFILVSGKLGDAYGRRRLLIDALLIFALSSLLSGLTSRIYLMIISRFFQGLGAAIMAPTSMALLMENFEGSSRVKAIAWYSSISGLGSSIGLVLGGMLSSYWSWRIGFLMNIPISVVIICITVWVLEPTTIMPKTFDYGGTFISVLSVSSLIYSLNGSRNFFIPFVVAILLGFLFVYVEEHVQDPIMPLSILNEPTRRIAYMIRALFCGSMMGFWFFVSEYLQGGLKFSPVMTGIAFLPMTLPLFISAILVPRIVVKWGNYKTVLCAALITILGFLCIVVEANGSYWIQIFPSMILFGFGQGLGLTPLTNLGIYKIKPINSGIAASLVNTSQQLGCVLGVALMVNIGSKISSGQNLNNEFTVAMVVGLVISIIFTLLIFIMILRKEKINENF